MDRLNEMYDAQRDLQKTINGYDLADQTDEQRIVNIKENYVAIVQELGEVLNETGWKSWATSRHINTEAYKGELVDVFHFFMNLMLHVDMTPDDLYEGYLRKREVNVQRQLNNYDGVSTKCPGCKRALDDVTLTEIHKAYSSEIDLIRCACGAIVPLEIALRFLTD
jgi:dimeric dUTPase (all-alpha-NTP-PPase superfamily)